MSRLHKAKAAKLKAAAAQKAALRAAAEAEDEDEEEVAPVVTKKKVAPVVAKKTATSGSTCSICGKSGLSPRGLAVHTARLHKVKPKAKAAPIAATPAPKPPKKLRDDMTITVLKDWEGKEGTKNHKVYQLLKTGRKVGVFRKKAINAGLAADGWGFLRVNLEQGYISVD